MMPPNKSPEPLGFQHPGRADAMEITVEVKLEQGGRVVRRTGRCWRSGLW